MTLEMVWAMSDFFMSSMVVFNVGGIFMLREEISAISEDYLHQLHRGSGFPIFNRASFPKISAKLEEGVWEDDKTAPLIELPPGPEPGLDEGNY